MHEPVTDRENRSWTLGPELGRGLWGRSWQVTGPDGSRAVLKTSLGVEDLPGDDPEATRALAAACRAAVEHQGAWLQEAAEHPCVAETWGPVTLSGGRTGILLPDLGPSLAARAQTVAEALDAAVALATTLAAAPRPHGQLRPSNVFFAADGDVVLTDWLTEPVGAVRAELAVRAGLEGWLPPQAALRAEIIDDTWAFAQWLRVVLVGDLTAPRGMDRAAGREVRDQLVQRLLGEDGLPRFVDRVGDRVGTLIGRALSFEAEPSPPFRFHDWEPIVERLQDARALLEPRVVDVGPVVWPAWQSDQTFGADEPVAFSVRVGGSPGLEEAGDLVCGLRVHAVDGELETRIPVPGAAVQVRAERGAR
ncbi:MAG: hypothetical protein AAF211_10810, partial [Myxococcota bacterium]